jgi:hypothetical protein
VLERRNARKRKAAFRCAEAVQDGTLLWKEKEKPDGNVASVCDPLRPEWLIAFSKTTKDTKQQERKKTKGAIARARDGSDFSLSLARPNPALHP